MRNLCLGVLALGLAIPTAAIASEDWDDQPITAQERAQVIDALRAVGCTVDPKKIERDDNGYEADDARCANGVFDIELDRQFRITEMDRED